MKGRVSVGVLALTLTILIGPAPAQAQDTLLDVRTATDAEVATIRTDSARFAVPLRLLLGGIIFPDGSVQSTAAIEGSATPFNEPGAIVARDSAGGFAAGRATLTTTGTTPAVNAYTSGSSYAGLFRIDNPSSGSSAVSASTNGDGSAVRGLNGGSGNAGRFAIQNVSNDAAAIYVATNGGGAAIWGRSTGTGPAARFSGGTDSAAVSVSGHGPGDAIHATTNGSGSVVSATTFGTGSAARFAIDDAANDSSALVATTTGTASAGHFTARNTSSNDPALVGHHDGPGAGVFGSSASGTGVVGLAGTGGRAGLFRSYGNPADVPVLVADSRGSGPAAAFRKQSASGDIMTAEIDTAVVFRVQHDGNVYADGTFNSGGADLAESFAVEGEAADYEPGDVLVISERTDRTMERATEAYSTRVAGVYATQPGVLLSEHGADGAPGDEIPLGVVGVIPTKVTAEGGPIRRGDLLVTSATPGHAMRADPDRIRFGTVLGKALEPFDGGDTGVIRVLVSVR